MSFSVRGEVIFNNFKTTKLSSHGAWVECISVVEFRLSFLRNLLGLDDNSLCLPEVELTTKNSIRWQQLESGCRKKVTHLSWIIVKHSSSSLKRHLNHHGMNRLKPLRKGTQSNCQLFLGNFVFQSSQYTESLFHLFTNVFYVVFPTQI